ncbi:hypothetical protein WJ63_14365 [Burkholderia pyrrocinia]|nr:hypothetical protein WJ63_14365 [Burkholderia pyrrocinia]
MTSNTSRADALTDRDPSKTNTKQGLFRKFDVRRVDGSDQPGGKHHDCEYFVLDMMHDQHARAALRAYADACAATHPDLSADLIARYALVTVEQPALPATVREYPDDLTDTLRHVLGFPNFRCAPYAHLMRDSGTKIDARSEDEQAHVLHWLVKLVLDHGEQWADVAEDELESMRSKLDAGQAGEEAE